MPEAEERRKMFILDTADKITHQAAAVLDSAVCSDA